MRQPNTCPLTATEIRAFTPQNIVLCLEFRRRDSNKETRRV